MASGTRQDWQDFPHNEVNELGPTIDRCLQSELEALFDFYFYDRIEQNTFDSGPCNTFEKEASSDSPDMAYSTRKFNVNMALEPYIEQQETTSELPSPPYSLRQVRTSKKRPGASPLKRKRQKALTRNDISEDVTSNDALFEDIEIIPPIRKRGSRKGFNRAGELTLVGRYPPKVLDGVFYCPSAVCRQINGKDYEWDTQNGYKYHLINRCLQNPNSKMSLKRAAEDMPQEKQKELVQENHDFFTAHCIYCGKVFKSKSGVKSHTEVNEKTKNGRCLKKGAKSGTIGIQGEQIIAHLSPEELSRSVRGKTTEDYSQYLQWGS